MTNFKLIAAALFWACATASAQDVLLAGHVQQLILQPSGTEHCPPPCPATAPIQANGMRTVCVSNDGGCQTMEIKVDHVYRGDIAGPTRRFQSRIGEWGPSFPVTENQIVVSEEAGRVYWSPVTVREGRIFVDPKRLHSMAGAGAGAPAATTGDGELVALDEVLARMRVNR